MAIPSELRRVVVARAAGRCEYCKISQVGQEASFHIDHIIPVSSDGPTSEANLALACVSCSLRKGARLKFPTPGSDGMVTVFHPRKDKWDDHFFWRGPIIAGKTEIGEATIVAMKLNRELIISIRKEESLLGRHPPN